MSSQPQNRLTSSIIAIAVGLLILGLLGGIAINFHQDAGEVTETTIETTSESFDHDEAEGTYELQNTPAVEIRDLQEPEGPTFNTAPEADEFDVLFDVHPQDGDEGATIEAETTDAQPDAEIHIVDKEGVDDPATYDPETAPVLNEDDMPTHTSNTTDTYEITLDSDEVLEETQFIDDQDYVFDNETYAVLLYDPVGEEVLNQEVEIDGETQDEYAGVQQLVSDSDGLYNYPEHTLDGETTLDYNPEPVFAFDDLTVTYDYEETTTSDGFDDDEVNELWDIVPVAFLLAVILAGIAMAVRQFRT